MRIIPLLITASDHLVEDCHTKGNICQTLFTSESWCCSSWSAAFTPTSAKRCEGSMENIVVGAIALLLFLYLLVAMIRPEKF